MSLLDLTKEHEDVMLPEKYKTLSVSEMEDRIRKIKESLGDKLFIPGHHYQKNEVIQFADATGDSLQLAQICASNEQAEHIVFCGVHFMAETADILTTPNQTVYLPDMRAGCSMADMADIFQTERAWEHLQERFGDTILPLTYVNSTAAIKAFVGRNGGATVTSSNAKEIVEWAFTQKKRILFLPDQHLGRNTAYDLGVPLDHMAVWNPIADVLEYSGSDDDCEVILWKGHCSVHENFTLENIRHVRENEPDRKIIVHPECPHEVVMQSDDNGSTKYIIDQIKAAAPGTKWAIGTEMNLVNRLKEEHKEQDIISLNPLMCPCLTMNRIDLPHLLWCLESIAEGVARNVIAVDRSTSEEAIMALDRMLHSPQKRSFNA
ncbi:quinolinate synthetase [Sporosarcina newyorkensis 2681]|uniref:Quinolinate synthase n=1 Tax=Sporosarcina newyorkensis 2681 TaxID=1027292 RepID=F9DNK0_9BACL|nr:quinolinate synthase NadA [Sporosarcina newyorkensis]EGQ27634.1 quinolinate synthetase [Sporosarcina newyorkensis 2681]